MASFKVNIKEEDCEWGSSSLATQKGLQVKQENPEWGPPSLKEEAYDAIKAETLEQTETQKGNMFTVIKEEDSNSTFRPHPVPPKELLDRGPPSVRYKSEDGTLKEGGLKSGEEEEQTPLVRRAETHFQENGGFSTSSFAPAFLQRNEKTVKSARRLETFTPASFQCRSLPAVVPDQQQEHKYVRVQAGEKPSCCSECGKPLHTRVSILGGEKPHGCSECGKRFSQVSPHQGHTSIHPGAKCGKRFLDGGSLQLLAQSHAGEKPYCGTKGGKPISEVDAAAFCDDEDDDDDNDYFDDEVEDKTWAPGGDDLDTSEDETVAAQQHVAKKSKVSQLRTPLELPRLHAGASHPQNVASRASQTVRAGRRASPVWAFFYVSASDDSVAICNLCTKRIRRGCQGSHLGTTALILHMKRHHSLRWQQYLARRSQSPSSSLVPHAGHSPSSSSSSSPALAVVLLLRMSATPADLEKTGNLPVTPRLILLETRGRVVMVTKDLPGIVLRVKFGRTTLTVPYSSRYGYVTQQQPILLDAVSNVADRCTVAASEKIPCGGSSSITRADCEANNCCYDLSSSTSPCYYANDVTVQCTPDGQFVVVVSMNVTLPPLDLGSLQLVDSSSPSCSPVTSLSSFVLYQFPVRACGSTVQVSGGNVTYQNTMSAAITVRTGPVGSITRDSVYKLFFQCTYSGSQDVQVEAEVYTVAPPLPVVEQGPFDLELVIATDSSYGSYYVDADYPVTKTLRDPVAVEVHIVNRTDPNLVLTLGDCWVTPGPSASSQPQWSLLVNGCPYTGDNYLTSLVTVDGTSGVAYPSHYKRFVFEMFAFVDPVTQQALAEKIFIYCVAAACYPSATDPCTQSCPARRSGRAADKLAQIASSRKNVLLHSGPVLFEADQVRTSRLEQKVTVQCTLDGQFVVVVSENVTLPPLDLGSIQLVDNSSPSCSPVTSLSSFVMSQFPVSACGSTVQERPQLGKCRSRGLSSLILLILSVE
ncbi:ZP4 protein, partial [Polypterus senegalus]